MGQFNGYTMCGKDNQYLVPNQVLCSSNGQFMLRYQEDGNLVIYDLQNNNKAIWTTNTDGQPAWRTYMQPDGNFVVYTSEGQSIWQSCTSNHQDSTIIMQDDGYLVIYNKDKPIWTSETDQPLPKLVNAWILLNEDQPSGTNYENPRSCYQTLISKKIYKSIDILFICFVVTKPTSKTTFPTGDGSSYTIEICDHDSGHSGGLTNQDYMDKVIYDARDINPSIKIVVTLSWGDKGLPCGEGDLIKNIFSNNEFTPEKNIENFAANLMAYLDKYKLDGFDIDWEDPLSSVTTTKQFILLIKAIGSQFQQRTNKRYYLTLSPSTTNKLLYQKEAIKTINENIDFVNLQLYFSKSLRRDFIDMGVCSNKLAYGAKFEGKYQDAENAFEGYKGSYKIITQWRLNSGNFAYEQKQQQELFRLVFPS